MAFDPDAYLSQKPTGSFDPDAYLNSAGVSQPVSKPKAPERTIDTRPITDVANRALVAGTLGAPVDVATMLMRPFGYKEEKPFMGSEYIGEKMQQAGMVTPTRRPVAELLTGLAPSLITGGGALARYGIGKAGEVISTARGKPAAAEAERAKAAAFGELQPGIVRTEQELAELERQAGKTQQSIEQMQRQAAIQAQRQEQAGYIPSQLSKSERARLGVKEFTPPRVGAMQIEQVKGSGKFVPLRQSVVEQAAAQNVGQQGRLSQAQAMFGSAEQELNAAKQTVNELEQQLLARPGVTAEQFGGQVRKATADLNKKLDSARQEGSGFGDVIKKYGDELVVDTSKLINAINKTSTRNPAVIKVLQDVKSLAQTRLEDGEAVQKLTLADADSLRKYLSKDIFATEEGRMLAANKEVLNVLKQMRGSLINQTPNEYKQALSKFRTLSRPLDIVERNGALARVIDVDPLSTAEKLTEAQVTGEVIRKAQQGNPVFSRLLEFDPSLKESGRLYFTQSLFGKEVVPTEASLRTWLLANQRPLQQLGLYDEFRNIRTARETAQRAVNDAKGQVATAEAAVSEAQKAKDVSGSMFKTAQTRLADVLKTTEKPSDLAKRAAAAPEAAFERKLREQTNTVEKKRAVIESLRESESNLNRATSPQQVVEQVRSLATKLKDKGLIDEEARDLLMRQADSLSRDVDAQKKAISIIKKLTTYTVGIGGAGYLAQQQLLGGGNAP
jgi:hypothetical protein